MTAPTAPPVTSVAVTAAQAATYLNPDTADTGSLYIYHEAAVPASPGYLTSDLETLLRVAPKTSTAKTLTTFLSSIADLTTNGAKYGYFFLEPTVNTGSAFLISDLVDALNQHFPNFNAIPVRTFRALKDAIIYTTAGDVPDPQTFYTEGEQLIVKSAVNVTADAIFYQVVGGSHDGKFIRYEDVVAVIR